jgi:glycosyltransferase involved in cell wall biosynthesis
MTSSSTVTPLVSIITVTYNAEKYLEQTIRSVVNQTYKNIEYILIDGASTDETIAIIKRNARHISYWRSEPDKGIYDAMNKGIQKANGELIGIINASDFYQPDAVEKIVNAYLQHPQYGIFHGNANYYLANGLFFKEKKANPNLSLLYKGMQVIHTTFFVTKLTYQKNGLFDVRYRISGDYEFAMRNYKKGTLFFHVNEVISNFRFGGTSSQQSKIAAQECYDIVLEHGYPKTRVWLLKYKWKYYLPILNRIKQQLLKWKIIREYVKERNK